MLLSGDLIGQISYLFISNLDLNLLRSKLPSQQQRYHGDVAPEEVNHLHSIEAQGNPEAVWIRPQVSCVLVFLNLMFPSSLPGSTLGL